MIPPTFTPTPWLTNGHAQTLWRAVIARPAAIKTTVEAFDLPDGDRVELVWGAHAVAPDAPVVLFLHGLEGSIDSGYIRDLMAEGAARRWRTVLLHFRGTAGRPNRMARGYHSGHTEDIATVVAELGRRFPGAPRVAVGICLGGNALLKWLGETGEANPLVAAAAACVPVDLSASADALSHGFSRVYQHYLMQMLVRSHQAKAHLLDVRPEEWAGLRTFRTFDARLTAPLNDFASVDDYYARCSSGPFISRITVPTLLVLANDDPFVPPTTLRQASTATVTIERHQRGGHVGFLTGWWPRPWLPGRLLDGLAGLLSQHPTMPPP